MKKLLNKKYLYTLVIALMVITFVIFLNNSSVLHTLRDENSKAIKYYRSLLESKHLTFTEEPVKVLEALNPTKWKFEKRLDLNNVLKNKKINLVIYNTAILNYIPTASQEPVPSTVKIENDIDGLHAFIEDGKETFHIGYIGSTISDFNVSEKDVNYDGTNEIIITSGLFHPKTKIVGFNHETQKWEIWLQTGSIDYVDFENNGVKTPTTVAKGSIAPLVNIHIWNKNRFDTINVAQILGYEQMILLKKDNKVYFDTIFSNKGRKAFELRDGMIKEVEDYKQ